MMDPRVEPLICEIISGRQTAWLAPAESEVELQFLKSCEDHGVAPLVHSNLKRSDDWESWPDRVKSELTKQAMASRFLQELDFLELKAALREFGREKIPCLILKGAALAQMLYSDSHLRPRLDTDLLVPEGVRTAAAAALKKLGYEKHGSHSGSLIMFQWTFSKSYPNGYSHAFDLHWKISNAHAFSEVFSFQELAARAAAADCLGEASQALGSADALIVACLHRVGHHRNSDRLIWLYDIHLLAESLTEQERMSFLATAEEKGLSAVCQAGLEAASEKLGSQPAGLLAAAFSQFPQHARQTGFELLGKQTRRRILSSDLAAQTTLKRKFLFVFEHLFPPLEYMRRKHPQAGALQWPFLYTGRIVRGLWRLIVRER